MTDHPNTPTHGCKEDMTCICYTLALEPDDRCPMHGYPWPPRCRCGRFVKRKEAIYEPTN